MQEDHQFRFLLENVVSAFKFARINSVPLELIEELCVENKLKAKRLNGGWAILKNQDWPCLSLIQFEKVVKNLSDLVSTFNSTKDFNSILFNPTTFTYSTNSDIQEDLTNCIEIFCKNERSQETPSYNTLLLKGYEQHLITTFDSNSNESYVNYLKEQLIIHSKRHYLEHDILDSETCDWWTFDLDEPQDYIGFKTIFIFQKDCKDENGDISIKYHLEIETLSELARWWNDLDVILDKLLNTIETNDMELVAVFDTLEEALYYGEKLYPKIDLEETLRKRYYELYPT